MLENLHDLNVRVTLGLSWILIKEYFPDKVIPVQDVSYSNNAVKDQISISKIRIWNRCSDKCINKESKANESVKELQGIIVIILLIWYELFK